MTEKNCENCKHFEWAGEEFGNSGNCGYYISAPLPFWVDIADTHVEGWQCEDCMVWQPKIVDADAAKR